MWAQTVTGHRPIFGILAALLIATSGCGGIGRPEEMAEVHRPAPGAPPSEASPAATSCAVPAAAAAAPPLILNESPATIGPDASFKIAVIDSTGLIVPIGEYREHRWSRAPHAENDEDSSDEEGSRREREFMQSLVGSTWYAPQADGRTRVLKAASVVPADFHCQSGWALATVEGSTRTPGKQFETGTRYAFSLHPSGTIFDEPAAGSTDTAAIDRMMREVFDDLESDRIASSEEQRLKEAERARAAAIARGAVVAKADDGDGEGHDDPKAKRTRASITPEERAAFPIETGIELARFPGAEAIVYYVTGKRSYEKLASSKCPEISEFSGWVVKQGSDLRWMRKWVYVTDCDYGEAGWAAPLGVFRIGDDLFVLTGEGGYEDSRYTVYQIVGDRLEERLTGGGGGC